MASVLSELTSCAPQELHWFSQTILDYYLGGKISSYEFMRYFHMPNSAYLPLGECVVSAIDPNYDPYNYAPGILDGFLPPKG